MLEIGGIEAELAAAAVLGGVEGEVRRPGQLVALDAVVRRHGDSDRAADRAAPFLDRIGLREHRDDLPGDLAQFAAVVDVGQQHLELVAAQPSDFAASRHRALQPLGDMAKQLVASSMAKRVVDLLEPVEIEHDQGAGTLGTAEARQRRIDPLRHAVAIGQPGERIELREARRFLSAEKLFRHVDGRTAKAEEISLPG